MFFIVRAFDNLGLAFVFVSVVVEVVGASSSSVLLSDLSRASSNALTRFNLSSPQACFKNS